MRRPTALVTLLIALPLGAQQIERTRDLGEVIIRSTRVRVGAADDGSVRIQVTDGVRSIVSRWPVPLVRTWLEATRNIVAANPGLVPGESIRYSSPDGPIMLARLVGLRGSSYAVRFKEDSSDPRDDLLTLIVDPGPIDTLTTLLARADSVVRTMTPPDRLSAVEERVSQAAPAVRRTSMLSPSDVYFEFQVEKEAQPTTGSVQPTYPEVLRSAGVEGEVLAQFVVDTTGRVDMSTFKVFKSSHELFTQAVKNALMEMRFDPAEVGGRKVPQLVQRPFTFLR